MKSLFDIDLTAIGFSLLSFLGCALIGWLIWNSLLQLHGFPELSYFDVLLIKLFINVMLRV